MFALDDTIAAVSTPIGQGGIGIVRLSGPDAYEIAEKLFSPATGAFHERVRPNCLVYGHIHSLRDGRRVDEVLLALMRAPHTYTRQDVVEIDCHGGVQPLQEILRLCLGQGARLAEPGEFTLRAFVNGRLDLAQAEAVLDVIEAKTSASLRVAVDQLGGRLSRRVRTLRQDLLDVLAYLVATIDFVDQEIPEQDIEPPLRQARSVLDELLREAERGLIYRQGVRVAIVGRPNVGKSSLLNALLRSDRAIVTPIPGTTRDTLEETINLEGIPLVLVDTAGIAATHDPVERIGIARSRRAVESADLVLLMVDGSEPLLPADREVAALCADKPTIVLRNKSDLPSAPQEALLPDATHQAISALSGEGLGALEGALLDLLLGGSVQTSVAPLASNPRHRDLFRQASDHLDDALSGLAQGITHDLLSIDVSEAVEALGQVTGETASEDLLGTIFGRFCIGK